MWAKLAAFVIRNAGRVLSWAKSAWSAFVYSRFTRAVSSGASAIIEYCTKYPTDCWNLVKVFL